MPLGTMLYSENQFKKANVFFFKLGISNLLIIFFILNFFELLFSNSSQTTPVTLVLPKGTLTKSPIFNLISLS